MGLTGIAIATAMAVSFGAAVRNDGGAASLFAQRELRDAHVSKTADKNDTPKAALSAKDIRRLTAILSTAVDRKLLTASAEKLAASGQSQAVQALARCLVEPGFLRRLDALDVPDLKLANLSHILTTLAAHPTEASEDVGLALLANRGFQSDPDRDSWVLSILASVRPMSERVERVFRQTNSAGYRNSNALLLVANASPRSLGLFREMASDSGVPKEDRVDMIRWAIPAHRLIPSVVECVALLLDRRLEAEVDQALFETLFDFGGDKWFGKTRQPPNPQPWAKADTRTLQMVLDLGQRLRQERGPLSDSMQSAVDRTTREIRSEIVARGASR